MVNNYLDKETPITEMEESCNEVSYQEALNNDPEYVQWVESLESNCGDKPKLEKEND